MLCQQLQGDDCAYNNALRLHRRHPKLLLKVNIFINLFILPSDMLLCWGCFLRKEFKRAYTFKLISRDRRHSPNYIVTKKWQQVNFFSLQQIQHFVFLSFNLLSVEPLRSVDRSGAPLWRCCSKFTPGTGKIRKRTQKWGQNRAGLGWNLFPPCRKAWAPRLSSASTRFIFAFHILPFLQSWRLKQVLQSFPVLHLRLQNVLFPRPFLRTGVPSLEGTMWH